MNSKRSKRIVFRGMFLSAAITASALAMGCSTGPKVEIRVDSAITEDIDRQIAADPTLNQHDITVTTTGGSVHLAGQVGADTERKAVEALARNTAGVRKVENYVRFGSLDSPASN
jgi:osmotically-inducible protein OsmY